MECIRVRFPEMALWAVALATAFLWAVWVLWVPLLPTNLYVPLLDLGKITGYTWRSVLVYLGLVLLLFALYGVGYRSITRAGAPMRLVFGAGVAFCAELVWAYPATAADIFSYVGDGQLLAVHHVNPFVVPPMAYPSDPIAPYLAYAAEPTQYGPLWVLLSGAIAIIGRSNLLSQIVLFKLVAALAHVASAAVIYRVARRLTSNSYEAQASAYLFLWNPLLLWEMVGNGHNDGLMMLLGLIGIWLFVAGYDLLVLVAIAAASMVKVPVALVAAVLFVGLWQRSRVIALGSVALGLALAVAAYLPFWEGPDTLTVLRRTDLFTSSFASVGRLALEPALGLENATRVARTASFSLFAAVAVVAVLLAITAKTTAERLRPAYLTLLGAVLLVTTWFQAWYLEWPMAFGATLADSRRHLEIALLSLGGLLQYVVFIYLWQLVFPHVENLGVQVVGYVALLGPLALGLVVRRGHRWRDNL